MTAPLTAPVEALLREQVANGHFPSLGRALEVAVKTVDGRRASHALESLLEEALSRPGERGPPAFSEEVPPPAVQPFPSNLPVTLGYGALAFSLGALA